MPCVLSPLGFHLSASLKEKIWKGEYIDLTTALPPREFSHRYDKRDDKSEDYKHKSALKSFFIPVYKLLVSMPVYYARKFTERSSALFQHINIILETYRSFSGFSWFAYNEAFWQELAVQPSLQWGSKDVSLWLILFLPQKQPFVCQTNISNVNASRYVYKKGFCFDGEKK